MRPSWLTRPGDGDVLCLTRIHTAWSYTYTSRINVYVFIYVFRKGIIIMNPVVRSFRIFRSVKLL